MKTFPTILVPAHESAQQNTLCIGCNYSLRGLSSHRCPECGRGFDPNDPWSMNTGRPLGPLAKFIIRPDGRIIISLAIFAFFCSLPEWIHQWEWHPSEIAWILWG